MSYSPDARQFATHVFHTLQEIPLYDVHGHRMHSKSFAEKLVGLRSDGHTIDDWLCREEDPDESSSSGSGGRREVHVKITDDIAEDLIQCLHDDPTLTQPALSEMVEVAYGTHLDRSTISKWLAGQDRPWHRKRLVTSSSTVDPDSVYALDYLYDHNIDRLAWEDECAKYLFEAPATGWAEAGSRPVLRGRKKRLDDKINIAMSLSLHGLHDATLKWATKQERGFNGDDFAAMLHRVLPLLPHRFTYCWDRLTAHRGKTLRLPIWDNNHITPYLLPSAMPEFNPVEYANNFVRETVLPLLPTTREDLYNVVQMACRSITPDHCRGFVEKARREVKDWIIHYENSQQ
jgi:hypothetical protein